ncbi:MAG: alpha/beta fold hydrolase, partial [Candidatus Lokiarchaeota archaeon]
YQLSQKGYRVIAPDLPGHGKSNGIRGHFTMELITKVIYDLTTYCRERYGNEIYIMGSSLGGITSFYCWAYDKRLKGAICHNAAILNEKAYKDIIKVKGMVKLLVPLVPTLAKFFPKIRMSVWKYLDLYKLAKSKEVLNRIELLFKDPMVTQKYTLTSLKTQMRAPLANPIEKVKAPILLLVGGKDFLFSIDFMKEIYDRLPSENKDIKIIENASHLIFQENLKESIQIITQWLVKNK